MPSSRRAHRVGRCPKPDSKLPRGRLSFRGARAAPTPSLRATTMRGPTRTHLGTFTCLLALPSSVATLGCSSVAHRGALGLEVHTLASSSLVEAWLEYAYKTRSWRTPNHLRTRRISTQLVGPLLPGRQCCDTLTACTEYHGGSWPGTRGRRASRRHMASCVHVARCWGLHE